METKNEAGTRPRKGVTLGAVALLAAGAAAAFFLRGRTPSEGHAAPDLTGDQHPDGSKRAPDAFRPDATAPVTAGEREALRPTPGIAVH